MCTRTRKSKLLVVGFLSCVGLTTTPVRAIEPHAELKLMRIGDVQYMSGGINKKERNVLERHAVNFLVRVSFVGKNNGDRVRQVFVTLIRRDEGNSVVRLKTAGPLLLMSLPAGHYTLQAVSPGAAPVQSPLDLEPGKIQDMRVELDITPASATAAATPNLL